MGADVGVGEEVVLRELVLTAPGFVHGSILHQGSEQHWEQVGSRSSRISSMQISINPQGTSSGASSTLFRPLVESDGLLFLMLRGEPSSFEENLQSLDIWPRRLHLKHFPLNWEGGLFC